MIHANSQSKHRFRMSASLKKKKDIILKILGIHQSRVANVETLHAKIYSDYLSKLKLTLKTCAYIIHLHGSYYRKPYFTHPCITLIKVCQEANGGDRFPL